VRGTPGFRAFFRVGVSHELRSGCFFVVSSVTPRSLPNLVLGLTGLDRGDDPIGGKLAISFRAVMDGVPPALSSVYLCPRGGWWSALVPLAAARDGVSARGRRTLPLECSDDLVAGWGPAVAGAPARTVLKPIAFAVKFLDLGVSQHAGEPYETASSASPTSPGAR